MIYLLQRMNLHGHHNHSESIVYIRIHIWSCTFYWFGQLYIDMHPSVLLYFQSPKNPLWSTYSSLPTPLPKPWLLLIFLLPPGFGFSRQWYSILSDCLLSFSNMLLRFFPIFSWIDSSFLFSAKYSFVVCWHDGLH